MGTLTKDLVGMTFGRLSVIRRDGSIRTEAAWLCDCACGVQTRVAGSKLRTGHTRSCGCMSPRITKQRGEPAPTKHGHSPAKKSPSPTYQTWHGMIQRCTNPRNQAYHLYGGRGINVCTEWLVFANFLADMGERPFGKTIDRIDNYKGYSPDNCRWATRKEQQNNMRWHQKRRQ